MNSFSKVLFVGVSVASLIVIDATLAKATNLVAEIDPGSLSGSHPAELTVFDNHLYFAARDGGTNTEQLGTGVLIRNSGGRSVRNPQCRRRQVACLH